MKRNNEYIIEVLCKLESDDCAAGSTLESLVGLMNLGWESADRIIHAVQLAYDRGWVRMSDELMSYRHGSGGAVALQKDPFIWLTDAGYDVLDARRK